MRLFNWQRCAMINAAVVLTGLLIVFAFLMGCAPKPAPSVDELNAREQERLAKEAAATP